MGDTELKQPGPSGLGFLSYAGIVLAVLIAVVMVWKLARTPESGPERPLPSPEREYADVTPVPLANAAERIPFLDDDAQQFSNVPGYVYALARLATLSGRPTRVWEAAVLSRSAFEFYYDRQNPILSDMLIDRAVALFARNAGLEIDRFQSAAGPGTVQEAETFLRGHLAAGRPVLFDHYEWGLFIGEEQRDGEPYFVAIGQSLKRLVGSAQKWRESDWWLRPGFDWVHNLVAVAGVYKQRPKAYEAERAALAATVIGAETASDATDLPPSYQKIVKDMPAGLGAYEALEQDLREGANLGLWLAGFPIQRVRFARRAAAAYFADAVQYFKDMQAQSLKTGAEAYRAEAEAWDAYMQLGPKGDDAWRQQKIDCVKKAASAQRQAIAALQQFYLELTIRRR